MVRLGDVCEDKIQRIKSISEPRIAYIDIASIDNVQKRVIGVKEHDIDDAPGRAQQVVIPGDVLVSNVRPNLNAVAIVDVVSAIPIVASTGFCVLRVKDIALPEYVYYYAQTSDFIDPLVAVSEKASYPSVTDTIVKDSLMPLPPLSVQREIVARLERELAAVEKIKKDFEALAETARAEFEAERLEVHKELLNGEWSCEPLKKHVDVLAGYAFKSQWFVDSGIRICGGLIIAPDRIKWEECKYWKSSEGIEQYLLQENDLVIALDRPWISGGFKIGAIGRQDLPCLLIQRTARLRMKDVDFRYVMMLLRDESFKMHCTTSGTTVPHISHKDIETYEIPFPPARVQKEIVARLSTAKARAEKLEAKAREGVAVCETMRKAILKEAFE